MGKQVRKITEGAAVIAILGVFMLINRYTADIASGYLAWLIPLPLIIYSAKYRTKATLTVYVSSMMVALMLSSLVSLIWFSMYGLVGVVYGHGLVKKWDNRLHFLSTAAATTVIYFMTTIFFASFFGYDINTDIQMITEMGNMFNVVVDQAFINNVRIAIVISLAMGGLLEAFIIHTLARMVLTRMHIKIPASSPIESIRLPKWLGWSLLAVLFLQPIGQMVDVNEQLKQIFFGLYALAMMLLLFEAFVFIIIAQKRWKIRRLVLIAFLLLIFVPVLTLYVYIGLGVLDMTTDIRERLLGVK